MPAAHSSDSISSPLPLHPSLHHCFFSLSRDLSYSSIFRADVNTWLWRAFGGRRRRKKRRKILRGNPPPLVKLSTILSSEECMTAQSGGASVVAGWGEEVGVVVPTVRTGNQGCSARGRVFFFETFWVTQRAAALTDKLNMHSKGGRCKQHKQTVFYESWWLAAQSAC